MLAPYADSRDRRSLVLLTLCLGMLIAQLDTSVVNLAIRPIGEDLHIGINAQQWVIDGYNLSYALLLLTGGLLGDLYGRRKAYWIGLSLFSLGCLICGLASGAFMLIGGRILSGVGAALLIPASLSILRVVWTDPIERGRALGIWAGCNGLAFCFGPTLGGFLIASFGWRSVFLIVLPLGAIALFLTLAFVPESADRRGRHFDLSGQVLAAIALGGLALVAIEGHTNPHLIPILVPVIIAAAILFFFFERQRAEQALIPLSLFRQAAFAGSFVATAAMTFGMYGLLFLVPLSWQTETADMPALTPMQAGLALMPMALVFFAISQKSGRISERIGVRTAAAGGTAIIGLGVLTVAASIALPNSFWFVQIGLLLTGIGMGLNTGPLMAVAIASVPPQRSGTAAAVINVARMVGATLGVAILGTIYAIFDRTDAGIGWALLIGGSVQIFGALVAWFTIEKRVCI